MVAKKFYKKAEDASIFKFLLKILIILIIAGILYLMIRRIGNAFIPK